MFRYVALLITLACLSLCAMVHSENNRKREQPANLPHFSSEALRAEELKLAELTQIFAHTPTSEAQAAIEEQRARYHQSLRPLTLRSMLEKSERLTPWFYGITGVLCLLTALLFIRHRREKSSTPNT